jgi:hypothetical protein
LTQSSTQSAAKDFSTVISNIAQSYTKQTTGQQPQEATITSTKKIDTTDAANKDKADTKSLPPLDNYREIKGHPYTVDYFKVHYWKELNPEIDVNKIANKIDAIEKYAQSKINEKRMNNTIESYKEIIGNIKSQLRLSDNDSIEKQLERVSDYIKVMSKQDKLDKEKRRLYGELSDTRDS